MTKTDKEGQRKTPILRFKGFTDDWEQRQLGEIGTTYSGLSGKNKSDFEKGNSNFVTFLEVLNNPILKNIDLTNKVEIKENEHQNKVKRNDILFNTSSETPEEVATSTVVDVNQSNLYLNSFCFGFRPNVKFSNYYIGYYLRSNHFRNRVFCLAQGISRYNISKKSLIKLKLSLPKLEEQDKIGKIFNQVELLLTLYERKLKLLSQVKKYFLDNLFTEKEYPNLRFKGFTDAWEQRKLGTITDTYSGGTPQVSVKDYYSNNEIPFIRSSDIHKNKTELYISSKGLENSSAKLVSKGHILYALYGATSGEVDISKIDGAINQAVLCINAHNDLNYFLMLFLSKNKDKIVRKYIQGGQGNLSASIIKKIKVFTTSELEETKISTLVKILSDIITLYENKQQHLTEIKKELLNTMFI